MIKFHRFRSFRTPLCLIALLLTIGFEYVLTYAAESSDAPIEKYDTNIQQLATAMIKPGWSINRRLNIARDRIQGWAELAQDCDDLSSNEGEFNADACDTFAYAYRVSRRVTHLRNCNRIRRWKTEKISDLNSALSESGADNTELAIATDAAIAQLSFELEYICDLNDDGFDGLYNSFHQVVYGTLRPSASYLRQRLQIVDSRQRAESFSTRTIILD